MRFLALAAVALGLGFFLSRRRWKALPAPVASPEADELRARLAESRAAEEAAPPPEPEPAASELDGRRADVHERARRALGELA
jgi:hypothetical protein